MRKFLFGVTTVLLTSAFFTQLLQDKSWMTSFLGVDWKLQFTAEITVAVITTLIGARVR